MHYRTPWKWSIHIYFLHLQNNLERRRKDNPTTTKVDPATSSSLNVQKHKDLLQWSGNSKVKKYKHHYVWLFSP